MPALGDAGVTHLLDGRRPGSAAEGWERGAGKHGVELAWAGSAQCELRRGKGNEG